MEFVYLILVSLFLRGRGKKISRNVTCYYKDS